MAVLFPRWTNRIPFLIAGGLPVAGVLVVAGVWYYFSPKFTDVGYAPLQPVAYSHQLHAGDLGIDCRYCHTTVDKAAFAAIPPTSTCMNCHTLVLPESPKLAPVRASYASGQPIEWVKVHQLPDYAYFNHAAHINAGVGCATCHGPVDTMKIVQMEKPLSMSWCLDCHRNPGPNLRPVAEVTNMSYDPQAAGYDWKADPHRSRQPNPPVHCSGCHR